jgi:hypothetical protein
MHAVYIWDADRMHQPSYSSLKRMQGTFYNTQELMFSILESGARGIHTPACVYSRRELPDILGYSTVLVPVEKCVQMGHAME